MSSSFLWVNIRFKASQQEHYPLNHSIFIVHSLVWRKHHTNYMFLFLVLTNLEPHMWKPLTTDEKEWHSKEEGWNECCVITVVVSLFASKGFVCDHLYWWDFLWDQRILGVSICFVVFKVLCRLLYFLLVFRPLSILSLSHSTLIFYLITNFTQVKFLHSLIL